MDDKPKKKEINEITTEAEMKESLRRCALLLKNATLVSRMPDGGKGLKNRFEALIQRAEGLGMEALATEYTKVRNAFPSQAGADDDNAADARALSPSPETAGTLDAALSGPVESDAAQPDFTPEQVSSYGLAMVLRNRNVRGDIYRELQKMYADNLSQREIQRLAETSSPNLLMSYDDTLEMERRFAEMERKAMLRRIRQRLAEGAVGGVGEGVEDLEDTATEMTEQSDHPDEADEAMKAEDFE